MSHFYLVSETALSNVIFMSMCKVHLNGLNLTKSLYQSYQEVSHRNRTNHNISIHIYAVVVIGTVHRYINLVYWIFNQSIKSLSYKRSIEFDVVDNKVTGVKFEGGCSGNTQGVAALVEGMDVNEAIKRMEGIKCGFKPTSCPDQLATALKQYIANK